MSTLPDDLNAISNQLFGVPPEYIQVYEHKFLSGMDAGDTVAISAYNVSAAVDFARGRGAAHQAGTVKIQTSARVSMARSKRLVINHEYAMSISLDRLKEPALVITVKHPISGVEYQDVADGNHRIYRAWTMGHDWYPGVVLSLEETERFRIPEHVYKLMQKPGWAG